MFLQILLIFCNLVYANDGASSGPMGGLELQNQENISIEKEDLEISLNHVKVSYVFKNLSGKNIETYIQFPLPPDGPYLSVEEIERDVNMKIKIDHKEIQFESKTKKVKVGSEDETQKIYFWKQKFPKNKKIFIEHSYETKLGASLNRRLDIENSCANKSLQKEISEEPYAGSKFVSYILLTAKTWKMPIKKFTLSVRTSTPNKKISACFKGLKKVSQRLYRANLTNFVPEKNLEIYFF